MARALLAVVLAMGVMAVPLPVRADRALITVDGDFDDWAGIAPAYVDPMGDGGPSGIDLGALRIADDDDFLYLRVSVGSPILLDDTNDLVLYLDTDNNSATGLSVGGIGAELEWHFGQMSGTFHPSGSSSTVYHEDIRFRAAPAFTASEFEIAIGRNAVPNGQGQLFTGSQVRILFRDESSGGDQLPNAGQPLTYTFDVGSLPADPSIPLEREQPGDLRIVNYNVHQDSPWDPGQEPRFGRQLAAVAADIYSFQEIYSHTPQEVADLVTSWVPVPGGGTWQAAGNQDCKIVTRFPILSTWSLSGNLAALLSVSPTLPGDLLLIDAHLPCCTNDSGRQDEVDEILSFLRDAEQPGGFVNIPANTPIVITGDLNLVGLAQQLTSLLTGDIVDNASYGPDFAPDWDGSSLVSRLSRQTEVRMGYTWRNDSSDFWPSQLDYQIATDSVLELGRSFLLYTPQMSSANLTAHGLLLSDSLASDHLIFCCDYRAPGPAAPTFVRGDCNADSTLDVSDPVYEIGFLFSGGPGSTCEDSCDANDDGALDIADVVYSLGEIFQGNAPLAPYPSCGDDPTADSLSCDAFLPCP